MENLKIDSIYPTTLSYLSLAQIESSEEQKFEQFWYTFVICSLLFDKLTIPIKGMLDDRFFHRLFKGKEKEIDKFTEFISPIMIGSESQTIKTAGAEFFDRKDDYLQAEKKEIESFVEKIGGLDFNKKQVDKLEFHKTYFDELLRFLTIFNRNGLVLGKEILLKGELTELIGEIESSQPTTWSETEYFGTSNAKTVLHKSKSIASKNKPILVDVINSLWIYTLQKMGGVNVNLPDRTLELFNIYHKLDEEDVEIYKKSKLLDPQELLEFDLVLKNKLRIPLPSIPSYDKMTLNDLVSLKNSRPMELYRELVGEIRKSIPKGARQIDKKINTIENLYNEYLVRFGDLYERGAGNRDKFNKIQLEFKDKFDFSNMKKFYTWVENAGLASNIISIGNIALACMFAPGGVDFLSIGPLLPSILDYGIKGVMSILKRKETTPLLRASYPYKYYYNPVLGKVLKGIEDTH